MLIRRELPGDVAATREVTAAAFRRREPAGPPEVAAPEADADQGAAEPVEVWLLDLLRVDEAWLPPLSMVAVDRHGRVVGHVLGTRGWVDTVPAVALGPVSVHPEQQRRGVGSALMHAVLGAADALDEPLVALLGDPAFYRRFGFTVAEQYGIAAPAPQWAQYFQVRTLTKYRSVIRGAFAYPEPFQRL
jgi:putative acetyltransferase